MNLCPHFPYCPIWVKFGIRNLHITITLTPSTGQRSDYSVSTFDKHMAKFHWSVLLSCDVLACINFLCLVIVDKQRLQVNCCIKASKSAPATLQMIQNAYGGSALIGANIYTWYTRFC
jgi:hypothetical protein